MATQMDAQNDPFVERLVAALDQVPGIEAIVLGGSRARGRSHPGSDYDIGLYFSQGCPLDTRRLSESHGSLPTIRPPRR